uniref:peroxidase n=1 Tax=Oryza barthii TaxID=65489 RepID=A0A0D3EZ05_9ORYZ
MASSTSATAGLLLLAAAAALVCSSAAARMPPLAKGLSLGYYDERCPQAEAVVFEFLQDAIGKDVGLAAALIRLHFHDCFVQGCDASILLDSTPTEKSEKLAPPNKTLRKSAFDAIDDLRDLLDRECGDTVVSCSDIVTLAARDSVLLAGGPWYDVPLGRHDGSSFASEDAVLSALPSPDSNVTTLLEALGKLKLDAHDLVALSGAHTVGIAHCTSFDKRLFPQVDPTMDKWFAGHLKVTCPVLNTNDTTVNDIRTPNTFDNKYYVDLQNRQGLFTSDQGLFFNATTKPIVTKFAVDQSAFFDQYVYSVVKMGMIEVLTGSQGQIRKRCSVSNAAAAGDRAWSVVETVAEAAESLLPSLACALRRLPATATPTRQPPVVSGLSFDFYRKSCPKAESVVRKFVRDAVRKDIGLAAGLLRLHFHDCFVQGCDASVLLDGSATGPGERQAPPNLTLRPSAFKAVNDIRDSLEKACGATVVSCSDILALAARDSVVASGGPEYKVPLGRRDSAEFASQQDVLSGLPPPTAAVPALLDALAKIKLDATDLVALSGGHTVGLAHCSSFEGRLFPRRDPAMNATFAGRLRRTCPAAGTDRRTPNDVRTPNVFDNMYYVNLVNREGLFTSDQDLFADAATKPIVEKFAADEKAFFDQFAVSMVKMGQISVLTGSQGQVRRNCSARNPGTVAAGDLPWSVLEVADSFVF